MGIFFLILGWLGKGSNQRLSWQFQKRQCAIYEGASLILTMKKKRIKSPPKVKLGFERTLWCEWARQENVLARKKCLQGGKAAAGFCQALAFLPAVKLHNTSLSSLPLIILILSQHQDDQHCWLRSPSSSPSGLLHPPRHGVHIVSNQALPLPAQPHPPAARQPGRAVVAGGRHQDGGGEVVRRTLPPWSSHWATGWLVITNYHFGSFPALAWF